MGVAADIVASWTRPRQVIRKHLQAGQREDRALVFLMLGCALWALSQLPALLRRVETGESPGFGPEFGGLVQGWLFIAPLALYAIAALSHILALVLRGQGSWYGARLALFWAVLAAAPLLLVNGLVSGFLGNDNVLAQAFAACVLVLFLAMWLFGLFEAEYGSRGHT